MNCKKFCKFPFVILKKIIDFLKIEIYEYKNPFNKRHDLLINKYRLCGFNKNREIYINNLNKTLEHLKFPLYNESYGMYSEHLIIFSAISSSNLKIKNILEIGTYDGTCTLFISYCFKKANSISF